MGILLLILLSIPNPVYLILFGMVFAFIALIPIIRNWNRFFGRRIVTSLGLAIFAMSMFYYLSAYGSVEMTLYRSHAMNPPFFFHVEDGFRDAVKRELLIRALRPRLDFQPCYSGQKNICEIANTVEIYANEGYAPLQETLRVYWLTVGFTFLWVWIGCLITVIGVTRIKQVRVVSV